MTDQIEDRAPFTPAPDPAVVFRTLLAIGVRADALGLTRRERADLIGVARRLSLAYFEAYEVAYSRTVRGAGGGSSQIEYSSTVADVTVATRQRYLRNALDQAAQRIAAADGKVKIGSTSPHPDIVRAFAADALSELRAAATIVRKAMEHDGIDPADDAYRVKNGRFPEPMHPSDPDRAALEDTQRRRVARGDGIEAKGIG